VKPTEVFAETRYAAWRRLAGNVRIGIHWRGVSPKLMEAIQRWEGAMTSIATHREIIYSAIATHREIIYAAALGTIFTVAVVVGMAGCLIGN